jgi:uncharacterized protein
MARTSASGAQSTTGLAAAVLYDGASVRSNMQLTRDNAAVNLIRAWEPGRVRVADRWLEGNVIIGGADIILEWTSVEPGRLTIAELEPALALQPTIIVLGTGTQQLLPDVELMAAVAQRAVGLEIMNTPAACRTFNVLLQEQRRVVAALFNSR